MNLPALGTVLLLFAANTLMIFAWYGHLRDFAHAPWWQVVLASWSIAFVEYLFLVPANRLGYNAAGWSLVELKMVQEVLNLTIFFAFVTLYFKQGWRWDYLWAALCLLGAVFFVFRGHDGV